MLKFNLKFTDLYEHAGLKKVDAVFHEYFLDKDVELYSRFKFLGSESCNLDKKQKDEILIESARVVEDFLVEVFDVEKENDELRDSHKEYSVVSAIKRDFIQRKIAKKFKNYEEGSLEEGFLNNILGEDVSGLKACEIELRLARKIKEALDFAAKDDLQDIEDYCRWALFSEDGQNFHEDGALFKLPKKIDCQNLVDVESCAKNPIKRDGFDLIDKGFDLNQALCEANYCIFCHNQEKDSCRTGLKEKKSEEFAENELGVKLEGCPLDQKISEMNLLKSQGYSIASMVVTAIDNPLMAATGHRICNDCMKSCIFQKQEPVDIPQIESENLKDVLKLPYGFEIYSLISRWNPLKFGEEMARKNNGKKILVAGLGPAGFALSYYLLNKGYDVVAIDGLKIEPLDPKISGIDQFGKRCDFKPIKDVNQIREPLSSRVIQGFGGVSEYGITSRWDKNFLTVIRLLLERRASFRMFGGLRFGSSIDDETAFNDYGFDHIALCIGAGRPNIVDLKNNFCKGVRSASDFLMGLQLGGAFKEDLFTNLQVRVPIVVIGAGLTATDTATEAQEYYVTQIKKFKKKVGDLEEFYGEDNFWGNLNEEERGVARGFLDHEDILSEHGKEFLFKKIGKTKIVYRKKMQDSPAYRQNHEELKQALRQGVEFVENCVPTEVIADEYGAIKALKCEDGVELECRALFAAAGTAPNISIVDQDKMSLDLDGKYFAQVDLSGNKLQKNKFVKHGNYSFFTKIGDEGKSVSFFGDLHPNFEGNVVRAIASAKIGHEKIDDFLSLLRQAPRPAFAFGYGAATSEKRGGFVSRLSRKTPRNGGWSRFLSGVFSGLPRLFPPMLKLRWTGASRNDDGGVFDKINKDFLVKLSKVQPLSDSLNEVEISAPLLANRSEIGHIFRLQNYYNLSKMLNGQTLMSEGMALTATRIDRKKGLISGTLLDYGGSTSLVRYFQEGQPCIFMGPSGEKTKMFKNETILLIGSGRGNAVLARMAEKFKKNGCRVILCLNFKDAALVGDLKESVQFSDSLIVSVLNGGDVKLKRRGDFYSDKEVGACLKDYFSKHGEKLDQVFVIGNDKFMKRVSDIRKNGEVQQIKEAKSMTVSLNASMQCMMKGVCSQCLQKKSDGEYYFSCASQDQKAEEVDFEHLTKRCDQNSLQEKVTKMTIKSLIS